MKIINFISMKFHRNLSLPKIKSPKNMKNSENLSIKESKKPPNFVDLLVNRAIAPSHPSIIPVINTKMENKRRLCKNAKEIEQRIEKKSIVIVAKFGVKLILIKPFAIRLTNGLKINLNRNIEGIFLIVLWDKLKYISHYKIT
jgi:hypothetical protein